MSNSKANKEKTQSLNSSKQKEEIVKNLRHFSNSSSNELEKVFISLQQKDTRTTENQQIGLHSEHKISIKPDSKRDIKNQNIFEDSDFETLIEQKSIKKASDSNDSYQSFSQDTASTPIEFDAKFDILKSSNISPIKHDTLNEAKKNAILEKSNFKLKVDNISSNRYNLEGKTNETRILLSKIVLENCINPDTALRNAYDDEELSNKANELANKIRIALKDFNHAKRKVIVQVTIGQINNDCLKYAYKSYWDNKSDYGANYIYFNDFIYCIVTVFTITY